MRLTLSLGLVALTMLNTEAQNTCLGTGGNIPNGTELIVNGDFSSGNSGFSSDYPYVTSFSGNGMYTVDTNANVFNNWWQSHGHTTGADKFFIMDASTSTRNRSWYETVTISQNTEYVLQMWVTNLIPSWGSFPDP